MTVKCLLSRSLCNPLGILRRKQATCFLMMMTRRREMNKMPFVLVKCIRLNWLCCKNTPQDSHFMIKPHLHPNNGHKIIFKVVKCNLTYLMRSKCYTFGHFCLALRCILVLRCIFSNAS